MLGSVASVTGQDLLQTGFDIMLIQNMRLTLPIGSNIFPAVSLSRCRWQLDIKKLKSDAVWWYTSLSSRNLPYGFASFLVMCRFTSTYRTQPINYGTTSVIVKVQ